MELSYHVLDNKDFFLFFKFKTKTKKLLQDFLFRKLWRLKIFILVFQGWKFLFLFVKVKSYFFLKVEGSYFWRLKVLILLFKSQNYLFWRLKVHDLCLLRCLFAYSKGKNKINVFFSAFMMIFVVFML